MAEKGENIVVIY